MPRIPEDTEQSTTLSRAPTMVLNSYNQTAPQDPALLQRSNAMRLANIGFWFTMVGNEELPEYSEEECDNPEECRPGCR